MSEEDKLIQQKLVEEIMKASEKYPNAILYMETLMKDYERLEQELTEYKERCEKAIKLIRKIQNFPHTNVNQHRDCKELIEILEDKEKK